MINIAEGVLAVCRDKAAVIKSVAGAKITIHTDGSNKIVKAKELIPIHPGAASTIPQAIEPETPYEDAAELMGDETLSFADFCELLYGKYTPQTAWSAYLEAANGVWFSLNNELEVSCKSAEEREKLIAEREAKEAEKRRRSELLERLQKREMLESDRVYLREIEAVALGKSENSKLLKELGIEATPEKAHKLLLELGAWDIMLNPWIARMKEDTSVPEFPLSAATDVPRTDLTHLAAYAIDDKTSNDPDDALSFADGLLYVHIADPADVIEFGGEIEKEASLRGESLYLPELLSPMLPEEVRLKCALGLEETNNAITFILKISDDGDVTLKDMVLSKVKVTRLSYEGCNELLGQEDFKEMTRQLELFKEFRVANGARLIRLPEVKVKAADNKVEITPLPITFERELVANSMLAAGYAVAKYMSEQDINFPFVVQPEPDEEAPEGESMSAMYARRRASKSGSVEFKGARHSGLGVEPYSRVTSPLRRYADLLAHYQLRSLITGTEPLSYEELESRMTYAENAAASRRKLEKYSNEYYTIVYLAQHPEYETTATLVARQNGQLTFMIPELAYEYKCRLQGNFTLDTEYKLTLHAADPAAMRTVFKVTKLD